MKGAKVAVTEGEVAVPDLESSGTLAAGTAVSGGVVSATMAVGTASALTVDFTPIHQSEFLIGGVLEHNFGPSQDVYSPCKQNGSYMKLGSYPLMNGKSALRAATAASEAYADGLGEWPSATPEVRIAAMEHFVTLMKPQREKVANLIMLETAKPQPDCFKEFDRTVEYIEKTIESYRTMIAEQKPQSFPGGLTAEVDRTPLGVTLCMGPFNYPLNETFTSMIPALMMGNTVVMKPARFGVLLFEPLLEAFKESFPPGVVNTVYGEGKDVVTPIMQSGMVDTLAFIGSTKVANIVAGTHPQPHRLNKILGLGAHNPSITLPGTDIEKILPELVTGSLSFNGQRCTTLALHFVHRSQGELYATTLADAVSAMKIGAPWEPGVKVTPLAEGEWKVKYLRELIDDAVAKGARVVNKDGGKASGNTMIPAVLYPVTKDMRIYSEEQFGPVVPIVPYDELSEVTSSIASSRFGQQVSLFGPDGGELRKLAVKLHNLVGRVNINSQSQRGPDELPFSGRKDSAMGVLSIREALNVFSLPTVIAIKE